MRVQYTGERERTVGVSVVYPGELLEASPSRLAAWQAEHGDVFAVIGEAAPVGDGGGAIVVDGGAAHVFDDVAQADAAAKAAKGRRK